MSQDHLETTMERARLAVGAAHDEFQTLYAAAHQNSIPSSLVAAGADLDQLSINLALLVSNANAFIIGGPVAQLFQTSISSGVTLSRAIVHDMSAIAKQLRSMRSSGSSESPMDPHHCQDIGEMVKRYDRIVSSVLHHHTS
jgi:3-phosphoglycerate kinase